MFETLTQRLGGAFAALRGQRELSEANIEDGLRAVRTALLEADVHYAVARDFVERVKSRALGERVLAGVRPEQQFVHAVHRELVELLGGSARGGAAEGGDVRLRFAKTPPTVVLMAGLQGAGKTTTCGKLARWLREKHQRRPLLVAADVKRPGAVEQLRQVGAKLGLPVFHEPGLAPPELCARGIDTARRGGQDVVLLDTAGRLHVDEELMAEVGEIAARTSPHEQLLVVDAMTGQDAVRSAAAFHARLELGGVILTKIDGDARGGAAVSLRAVTGVPVLFVGTGEKLEDLDAFVPERMAGRILGMGDVVGLVERAQEQISEREAEDAFGKLLAGRFTLDDQLGMMKMMKRLGPLKKVLGMLPGVGGMLEGVDLDDRRLKRVEALMTSMTPFERLHPEAIDVSRRRRIARGAGQELAAVNELLKGHKTMGQVMKQMNRLGLAAQMGGEQKLADVRQLAGGGRGGPGASGSPSGSSSWGSGPAAPGVSFGGLDALGGLGGGMGAGASSLGRAGAGPGGFPGLLGAPRPMGSSPTKQSGKRKEKRKKRGGRR